MSAASKASRQQPFSEPDGTTGHNDLNFWIDAESRLDYPTLSHSAHIWPGESEGRDSFVFLMDGPEAFPWDSNDSIPGFNITDDRIILVSPEQNRLTADNIRFCEDAQQLSIHWQYGEQQFIRNVEIRSHDGQLLHENDILKAVQIL